MRDELRTMSRLRAPILQYLIPRKKGVVVKLCLTSITLLSLTCGWLLSETITEVLLPSSVIKHLNHFRSNRNLKRYIDEIEILIEPSSVQCKDIPLLILVASSPNHFGQRDAIRKSWGGYFPTYFIMGVNGGVDGLNSDNYLEAKYHSDIIMYNFQEHYQNLTLKTGLMLHWSKRRCSPDMLLKTDDDVMINPVMMNRLLAENRGRDLVGYKILSSSPHRNSYNKWYLPKWLYHEDIIPEYLSGTGYLINGKHIDNILSTSYKVPMINLEDVYFTCLVAKQQLNLTLSHDHRLSPYKPWFKLQCVYFGLALLHSLSEEEMRTKWWKMNNLMNEYKNNNTVCDYFLNNKWSEWFLY